MRILIVEDEKEIVRIVKLELEHEGYDVCAAFDGRSGLEAALQGTEEEATLHLLLGTVYQQQRSYEPAIEEFRAALRILPGMRDALFSLGWTYSLVGNRVEARRFLRGRARRSPRMSVSEMTATASVTKPCSTGRTPRR